MSELPGTPRVHAWTGLVLSLLGIAVAGYAYTGDRAYHIEYVAVAVLGFALVAGGSLLTGYGQANRPRMGGKKTRSKKEEDGTDSANGGRSVKERLTALVDRVQNRGMVEATVACPSCDHVFDARGRPPFEATCPSCAHTGTVEQPRPLVAEPDPARAAGPPPSPTNGDAAEPGPAAKLRRRGVEPVQVTLSCDHCDHVFSAHGRPPFPARCPSCGYRGTVTGRTA